MSVTATASQHPASHVLVVGSANHDIVLTVPRFPGPGETVVADQAVEYLGGKGQSQAIAARRFGSPTALLASVGHDEWGRRIRTELTNVGVDATGVRTAAMHTGRAIVVVDSDGENSIVVERGANAELRSLLPSDREAIARADLLLVQFEVGEEIALEAIRAAQAAHTRVILNAAPAIPIPQDVLESVDYLVANEVEVSQLTGQVDVNLAAQQLTQSIQTVLVTLGAEGGVLHRAGQSSIAEPAPKVDVVDTTGAGDTVSGVFASAIAQGYDEVDAFRLGLVAGSLATEIMGCVPSIPGHSHVLDMFAKVYGRPPLRTG